MVQPAVGSIHDSKLLPSQKEKCEASCCYYGEGKKKCESLTFWISSSSNLVSLPLPRTGAIPLPIFYRHQRSLAKKYQECANARSGIIIHGPVGPLFALILCVQET